MIHHFGRVDFFIIKMQRAIGEEINVERGTRNHAHRIADQQRAVVLGLDRGDLLAVIEDGLREALQNRMATFGAERGPLGIRAARRCDRGIDFFGAGRAHIRQMLAVDWRAVSKLSFGLDPLAVDEVIGRDVDARNFGGCHEEDLFIDSMKLVSSPAAV